MIRSRLILISIVLSLIASACGRGDLQVGAPQAPVCAAGGVDGFTMVLANWPDYMPTELVAAFERTYGITVRVESIESNEALLSEIQARADTYDLIVPSDYMVDIMRKDGLLLPLDPIALPGRMNLDPLFANVPFDPTGEYSVPYLWGTVGLGVNTNVVRTFENPSWSLLFDLDQSADVAGRASLLNDPRQAMAAALMYLGFSPNTQRTEEIAAAASLIETAKVNWAGFDSEEYAESLVDGALDVAHGRSDAFLSSFSSKSTDYRYLIPAEGAIAWVDNFAIPITSTSPCTAHAFIDFMLEARNAADLANYTGFASPNLAAFEYIEVDLLSNTAIYPSEEAVARLEFLVDVGELELTYVDQFSRAQGP